ncbi:MAG: family ATPase, partial [Acidimicrobiales bacterium]|nr:family ATPase [Acidimicrobiales bacterium]
LRPRQRLLLVGPSGSGKTSVAHAIADRLSLPLASANLAALTSSYLGETARNIEAVMTFADANPCVLLLDEFDALAGERSRSGDHGELRRVVATVLQAMDEVRGESITVATSNHPGLLDSAIWRRFDEVLALSHPEASERRQLLATKLAPLPTKVNIDRWVKELAGTSAADVERTCLDALRLAVLEGASATEDRHLVQARSRLHARGIAVATVANPSLS